MTEPTLDEVIAFNLSVFAVPVIPGPDVTPPAAGRPGHLERLVTSETHGLWPLSERWRDLTR